MIRKELSIEELKANIGFEWRPVNAVHAEDQDANPLPVVNVDLICEWRMDDGKTMFVKVPYKTPEELGVIIDILQSSVEPFAKAIKEIFADLQMNEP